MHSSLWNMLWKRRGVALAVAVANGQGVRTVRFGRSALCYYPVFLLLLLDDDNLLLLYHLYDVYVTTSIFGCS